MPERTQEHPLDTARRLGVVADVMLTDMRRLIDQRPRLIVDDAAMAAALRGLGYTPGEVDARLNFGAKAS